VSIFTLHLPSEMIQTRKDNFRLMIKRCQKSVNISKWHNCYCHLLPVNVRVYFLYALQYLHGTCLFCLFIYLFISCIMYLDSEKSAKNINKAWRRTERSGVRKKVMDDQEGDGRSSLYETRNVRRILVRGSMPPCRLRRRNFWKFDYEIVHFEVYLNK